jgi:phage terminase small subunit
MRALMFCDGQSSAGRVSILGWVSAMSSELRMELARPGGHAEPPAHLSEASAQWWADVVRHYEMDSHHILLLTAAAEELDTAMQARQVVEAAGLTVLDRFGQSKPHPMLDVARQARNSFRLLVRELGLDVSAPAEARAPVMPGRR